MDTINRAQGRWREILPALGIDAGFLVNKHGPCPLCGGRDRFRFDDRGGDGTWICGGGGGEPEAGDGIALLMHVRGCDFATALKAIAEVVGAPSHSGEFKRSAGKKREERPKPEPMDKDKVDQMCRGVPFINKEWIRQRSPIDPKLVTPEVFF